MKNCTSSMYQRTHTPPDHACDANPSGESFRCHGDCAVLKGDDGKVRKQCESDPYEWKDASGIILETVIHDE
ncbi:unnamed protein product [Orchesella dallaii]|uniref:Uncharacterized protein n=1 Tax=Orchesella dallaii TaxID=48710 RepID=A0ABP1PKR2_9HEXA